jgi:hypothetical protein
LIAPNPSLTSLENFDVKPVYQRYGPQRSDGFQRHGAIEGGISFPLNVAAVKLQPTKSGSYTNGDPGSGNLGIGVGPNSGGADDVGTYDNGPGDFIEHSSHSDS